MKRDWELIKAILEALEEKEDSAAFVRPDDIKGWDGAMVSYNMSLLNDAGFIRAMCKDNNAGIFCMARGITWQGHELLDQMKSRPLWNRTMTILREKGLQLSWEAIKAATQAGIKEMISG